MLDTLRRFFESSLDVAHGEASDESKVDHACELATAALLVEVSNADFEADPAERERIAELLDQRFDLSRTELDRLMELADERARNATSLYEFTRLINDTFDARAKFTLVRMLWAVAAADGNIDRHEDHLVRKVADLIHVPHSEFIRAKHLALSAAGEDG